MTGTHDHAYAAAFDIALNPDHPRHQEARMTTPADALAAAIDRLRTTDYANQVDPHRDLRPWTGPIPLERLKELILPGDLVSSVRGTTRREGIAYELDPEGRWMDRYGVLLTPSGRAARGGGTSWRYFAIPAAAENPLVPGRPLRDVVLFDGGATAEHALVVDTGVIGAWATDTGQTYTRTATAHRVNALTDEHGTRWTRPTPDAPWARA